MNFAATPSQQGERLRQLRAEMARRKLDAFFVPLTDEYMNEYVPDCAQRLAWLSGFTGSAGTALVLQEAAYLFVDGRYTLQAAQQVDAGLYTIRHVSKQPLGELLKDILKGGEQIGYDPWLHTLPWIERVGPICTEKKAALVPVEGNPVDAVWKDRPRAPCAVIFEHPLRYAGEASAEKRVRLGRELTGKGLDAAIIGDPASVAWLLNVRGGDVESTPLPLSFAILHADGKVDWFVEPAKLAGLQTLDGVRRHDPSAFLSALKELGGRAGKVRVAAAETAAAIVQALQEAGAVIDRGEDVCERPKACKNASELEGMRAAHRIDGLALTRFMAWLAQQAPEQLNEMVAQEKLLAFRHQSQDFLYPSFPSISGFGPNGAIVHYRATPETSLPFAEGGFYLIDSGGQYPFGTTDVTRTLAIGTVSPAMRRHFTLVLKGHIGLARARFPAGTTGAQLDILAREHLWDEGLDYDHGTGHGVGAFLGVHEGPQSISSRGAVPLRPGMVISNEPGYYLAGHYGIRIENLVAVRESTHQLDGKPMLEFETLTLAPIDRHAIDGALLSPQETEWLNAYHRAVWEAHQGQLTPEERAWLQKATAPF